MQSVSVGFIARSLLLLAAFGLVSCATIKARSDYDPSVSFADYRSYAWISDDPLIAPAGAARQVSPLNAQRIRDAVDAELAAKGYTGIDNREQADFIVSFTVGTREKIDVNSYPTGYRGSWLWRGPYFGTDVEVSTYTQGTLAIDIFDQRARRPVWHGWATKRITAADIENVAERIRQGVAAILEGFPPDGP